MAEKWGRTQNFTTAVAGPTIDAVSAPPKAFSLQVKGVGAAATAWSVVLEGSNDGVTFSTILTHGTLDTDGKLLFTGTGFFPCKYFRSRVVSLTLGPATGLIVSSLGVE